MPYAIVAEFEKRVADYAGAPFAVAVDCCSNALFLCCVYCRVGEVVLPARTYCSVPMSVIHAGGNVRFEDYDWKGVYKLNPYPIYDGAKRFTSGMYEQGLHCLSFHAKKILAIGRGGMILTDDEEAYRWLKRARYDGREGKPYERETVTMLGWHMTMTPEQAARGIQLLDALPDENDDLTEDYPDLREFDVFKERISLCG